MTREQKANLVSLIVLVFIVILSRFPQLLGLVVADPMAPYSGLFSNINWGLLPGRSTIELNNIFTSLSLGHLAAQDWLSGLIPWWNPFEGVGVPLAAEMQSAALFLPFSLLLCCKNGQLFFQMLLQFVAGLSTYFLLRQLGISRIAAIAGGALFELNGTFVWLCNAAYNPIAFLPMLLWGVERAWAKAKEGKARGWRLIAISLAWSLYAGFPETAYINGLMAAVWTILRFCQSSVQERLLFSKKIFAGVLTGIMLAAPLLVAFCEYLPLAYTGQHLQEGFAQAKFYLQYIPQIFLPYLYGPIFDFDTTKRVMSNLWGGVGGYLGASMLFFCLLSLWGSKHRAIRFVLLGWIVISMAKTFRIFPLSDALNLLPFVKLIAFYRYCPPTWELSAILLTAFALDDLFNNSVHKIRSIVLAIVSLGSILLLPRLLAKSWLHDLVLLNSDAKHWLVGSLAWALLLSSLAIIIAICLSDRKLKTILIAQLLVIEVLGLFVLPAFSNPQKAHLEMGGVNFLKQHLGLNRFYSLGSIQPNIGSYFGLSSINHNDLPVPRRWTDYVQSHLYTSSDPTLFLGVSVDRHDVDSPIAQFSRNLDNYQWVGVKYIVAPCDSTPFSGSTDSANFGPKNAAFINTKPVYHDCIMNIYELRNPQPYFEVVSGVGRLKVLSGTELEINCDTKCTLLRRELFFPGWNCTINGVTTAINEYGKLFQAVDLPQGRCHIHFSYVPPYTGWAAAVFAMACILLIGQSIMQFLGTQFLEKSSFN